MLWFPACRVNPLTCVDGQNKQHDSHYRQVREGVGRAFDKLVRCRAAVLFLGGRCRAF